MTLYFRLNERQAKGIGFSKGPENVWVAVYGSGARMEAFISSHLYEIPYFEVRLKLAELSGDKEFMEHMIKEEGEERVKDILKEYDSMSYI
jgi:hypothetical protein